MTGNPAHLDWTVIGTPVGDLIVAATAKGVSRVSWVTEDADQRMTALASEHGMDARRCGPTADLPGTQISEWFDGRRTTFDLEFDPDPSTGGSFGARVLAATDRIPFGGTLTYGEIAREAGSPGAARAVGNALAANPLPIVIPCHRVVAASGIGGFTGGVERKSLLLGFESAGSGVSPADPPSSPRADACIEFPARDSRRRASGSARR